jgi:ER membrane protein complex subunit 7
MNSANDITVDDETKAEFEEMQKSNPMGGNPAAAMQNFDIAGWMAGKASGADAMQQNRGDSKRK